MPVKQADLYYKGSGSDKEYHVQIEPKDDMFVVNFQFGRRGSSLTPGTKTPSAVPLAVAQKIFDKLVAEKTGKGYSAGAAGTPYVGTPSTKRVAGFLPQLPNPIDDEELENYLSDPGFGMQEKKDGKHVSIEVLERNVKASNKKGLEIGIPEVVQKAVLELSLPGANNGVMRLDGELIGDVYHAFDLLRGNPVRNNVARLETDEVSGYAYRVRHGALSAFFTMLPPHLLANLRLVPLAVTESEKREMYAKYVVEKKEGVVFKSMSAPYRAGRPDSGGDMLKLKFYATASFIVADESRAGKHSVALELLDSSGSRVPVGNVTIKPSLSLPAPGTIVEVRYLYAYKGGSVYQPTFLGVRDDIDAEECLTKQLKYKAEED